MIAVALLGLEVDNVPLGAAILGAVAGAIGCFALLRRQSLMGDALAHATLPGVCLGFMVAGGLGINPKHPLVLLGGALLSAWIGALFVLSITRRTQLKQDAALGIVLSVFFGVGIVLLTYLQHGGAGANQAGLNYFLFGQAAALVDQDVLVMALLGAVVLATIAALFKPFQLITFDVGYAASVGLPVRRLEVLLTSLIVVAVVVGLQTVGVVLMAAMIVTPAAAARQWTDRLGVMVVLGAAFGALAGVIGAHISALGPRLPTGPVIVLSATGVLLVSLALSPRRGLVWAVVRRVRNRRRIQVENLLKDFYRLGERDGRYEAARTPDELRAVRPFQPAALREAERRGFVDADLQAVRLTEPGIRRAARVVRNHRLWECYLSRRLDLADDHLHRDAEDMEHVLDDEVLERIDEALGRPDLDPHGRTIPRGAALEAGS